MTLQPLPHESQTLAHAGLTARDQRRIQEALDSSTSANTRRAYNQGWRRFQAWAEARGIPSLPGSPELVAAFLAELAEQGLSVATLRLQKSALAAVHRSTGHPDPTDNEGVRKVMTGIARTNGRPQRQAKPLTEPALGRREGDSENAQTLPWQGGESREVLGRREKRAGGCSPGVGPPRRAAPPVGGRGAALGRRGAAGGWISVAACAPDRRQIRKRKGRFFT